jgi:hypothetical protein
VRYTEVCYPGLGFVGVNSRALRAYTVPHSLSAHPRYPWSQKS